MQRTIFPPEKHIPEIACTNTEFYNQFSFRLKKNVFDSTYFTVYSVRMGQTEEDHETETT